MAQSVEVSGLKLLQEDVQKLLKALPEKKRALHETLSEQMLREVEKTLRARAKTYTGDLMEMQNAVVGTLGGYAAIRPKKNENEHGYAYGYITNAAESGHAIRKPGTKQKHKYRARIKTSYVLGLKFYDRSKAKIEKLAIDAANQLADEIAKTFE